MRRSLSSSLALAFLLAGVLGAQNFGRLHKGNPGALFEWVKFRSHLSRGVTIGTALQDDAFFFTQLGTFLEHAEAARAQSLPLVAPEHSQGGAS